MMIRGTTWRALLFAALALAGIAGAYWVTQQPRKRAEAQEVLGIESSTLDFGETWENPAFSWTIPVQNRSAKDVVIENIASSCDCVGVDPREVLVPAFQKVDVKLTVWLTVPKDQSTENKENLVDFELPFVPQVRGAPPSEKTWWLRGRVRRAIKWSERTLAFGELTRGQKKIGQRFRVAELVPLENLHVECKPPLAEVHVSRSGTAGNGFDVVAIPKQSIPAGKFKFDLIVQPITREGERLPGLPLPAEGVMIEDLQALPSSLLLGPIGVGKEVVGNLAIRSAGGKAFKIEKWETSSPDLEVVPVGIEADGGQRFRLTLRIARAGNLSATASFRVRVNGSSESSTIVVPVTGHGIGDK